MSKLFPFFFLLILSASSCTFFGKKDPNVEDIVAKAYDRVLMREELAGLIPLGTSVEDSSKIADHFIQSWLSNQVVLVKAESNLKDDTVFIEIDKKMQDYRSSLIRFAYEKELVNQKLDTLVSNVEIESFYNNNKSNFELKDNIIQVNYLKLLKKSPKLGRVKDWFKSSKEKDRKELEEYCFQFAENYFLDDNTWLIFDDLLKEIPIKTYDKEQFLKNNRYIEIADSNYIYLVNIKGFKIKNSSSPLIFERDNIINIILNKRKLLLIEEMEKSAYKEALEKNEIHFVGKK